MALIPVVTSSGVVCLIFLLSGTWNSSPVLQNPRFVFKMKLVQSVLLFLNRFWVSHVGLYPSGQCKSTLKHCYRRPFPHQLSSKKSYVTPRFRWLALMGVVISELTWTCTVFCRETWCIRSPRLVMPFQEQNNFLSVWWRHCMCPWQVVRFPPKSISRWIDYAFE